MMFHGSIPALVTPFNDHEIDVPAFEELIEWQITSGSSALVPTGTTGESPTLSHAEHKRVVEICIKQAAGRVPVIAGAGSNNTAEAIELSIHAEKAGADAVLIVMPYYNKPNQEGLIHHFKAIDQKIGIPIIIYNIPGRSIADMLPETMAKLYHDCRNIVGVKDATANMARASMQRQLCGTDFVQLSGEDITALGFCAHGGHGCISVTANVAPSICAEMQAACAAKDYASALLIQDRLAPLHRALFIEPSPQGVKYALSLLGKVKNELRLPMVPVIPETEEKIRAAMIHAGLLN